MNIFVAGASGLVGAAFVAAAAKQGHRVSGTFGSFDGSVAGLDKMLRVDLMDAAAVSRAVAAEKPEAIVNCAAVSVPEACEADPERAERLNIELPATLAGLANSRGARFVHLSSEQVFDGKSREPYRREDSVSPINLYGREKVESERRVHAIAAGVAVTLRAPLLMGNSAAGRRSLHERLLADWAAGKTPRLFTDEFRQPCTAENLARVMLELCEWRTVCGIYHWAGTELISRHALGLRIRARFDLDERRAPLEAVARQDVPAVTEKRQACLALDIEPLAGVLRTRAQDVETQLAGLHVPAPCRDWYDATR